ncbi:MAG: helix-turn-helix domain-containing protein [Gammaproteobacteria bacterium]
MKNSPRILTTAEASKVLGLSARQTRHLADLGRIPGAEKIGHDWIFRERPKIMPPERRPGRPGKVIAGVVLIPGRNKMTRRSL